MTESQTGSEPNPNPKHVVIYTDGSCLGNPGPGGYGAVLIYGDNRREISGGYRVTTNNRMELIAPIKALEALKEQCTVTIYSDSKYVVDAMVRGWALKWRSNKWMRNKKDKAVNPDLWVQLLDLCSKHAVTFRWVKGHAGDLENERADQLANAAASGTLLVADVAYESSR